MESLLQDLRYGARQLWRAPAFTVAAVATLALGIGANTALFSLLKSLVSEPMPALTDTDRLIWVNPVSGQYGQRSMSMTDYAQYRDGLAPIVDLMAWNETRFGVGGGAGEPEEVSGQIVSGNFFRVLGARFALGRGFLPSEDSLGSPDTHVAVIGYDLWQRRYNGDSAAVGRTVYVNGVPLTIVGVVADGFNGAEIELQRNMWVPIALHDSAAARGGRRWPTRNLDAIGRMKPGVAMAQVQPAANTIMTRLRMADSSDRAPHTVRIQSARTGMPPGAENQITPVAVLGAAVTGVILLLACSNVSNLLLARAVGRRREMGVRLSLGASRWRVTRQLLTESLLLALVAGGVGMMLAWWVNALVLKSGALPLRLDITPDLMLTAFTVLLAGASVAFFGVLPAMQSTGGNVAQTVKDSGPSADPRRTRLQSSLVVAQVALSLAMLTTAGLFLRSTAKANAVDLGFDATSRVFALSFDLRQQNYDDARVTAFISTLTERAERGPRIEGVSFTNIAPLGNRSLFTEILVENATEEQKAAPPGVAESSVQPGYFHVLGMRLLQGRDFGGEDVATSMPTVIIDERLANRMWPTKDALGKRIKLRGEKSPARTIVGIVSSVMLAGPGERVSPVVYVPLPQQMEPRLTMLARSTADTRALAEFFRAEIRAIDPNLPLVNVQTMEQYKRVKFAQRTTGATILGSFGALALLLACVGVYGMMAFTVLQRRREIGIRMALGAKHRDVLGLFISRGMRLTGIGIAIGLGLSLAMSQLLRGMLFGLTPTDSATFAGVAAMLGGIALAAVWVPARRAAALDPAIALRAD